MTLMELASQVHRQGACIVRAHGGNVLSIHPPRTVSALEKWAKDNGIVVGANLRAGNGPVMLARKR